MNGTSGNDLGGSILVTYFVKIAFIIKTDSFLLSYFSKVFPTFLNLNFFFISLFRYSFMLLFALMLHALYFHYRGIILIRCLPV